MWYDTLYISSSSSLNYLYFLGTGVFVGLSSVINNSTLVLLRSAQGAGPAASEALVAGQARSMEDMRATEQDLHKNNKIFDKIVIMLHTSVLLLHAKNVT